MWSAIQRRIWETLLQVIQNSQLTSGGISQCPGVSMLLQLVSSCINQCTAVLPVDLVPQFCCSPVPVLLQFYLWYLWVVTRINSENSFPQVLFPPPTIDIFSLPFFPIALDSYELQVSFGLATHFWQVAQEHFYQERKLLVTIIYKLFLKKTKRSIPFLLI